MDMKRFILIVLSCALLLTGLAGCGKQNKVIKEHAQAVAEAFADGDMAAINIQKQSICIDGDIGAVLAGLGENTSQSASVEFVRFRRTNSARG